MRKIKSILLAVFALGISYYGNAQIVTSETVVPKGSIIYSLPSTTISFKVTAEHESFTAGPYAAYAKKFLGIDPKTKSGESYKIKEIEMLPLVEADPNVSSIINLGNSKRATANFLNFCSQGLIVLSDNNDGRPAAWRVGNSVTEKEFLSGITSNTQTTSTTLYRSVQTAEGIEKVPIKQTQVVEKSIEAKAEETAQMIFRLRNKRIDIITGDTDATFSGEAMDATLKEISKLEEELLSMFIGKSVTDEQVVIFDVIPVANKDRQMYIAFRLSDTEGLLSANDMKGRPFILELSTEKGINPSSVTGGEKSSKGLISYRQPMTVNAKLLDGNKTLLQSRIPIYQFGKIQTFPIEIAIR
jgi:hypothetical protein